MANALVFTCIFLLFQKTYAQFDLQIKYRVPQTRSDVGSVCAAQMEVFLEALRNFDIWAVTMSDANSKIPSGILTGNIYDLGSFDECLKIEHHATNVVIKGKHCREALYVPLVALALLNQDTSNISQQISNVRLVLSLCIPDACKPSEMSSYLNFESKFFSDHYCQTNASTDLGASDTASVVFLSVILGLIITSTAYDLYLFKTGGSSYHPVLLAFSVFTNGRKLITVKASDGRQLTFLHGLRSISIVWIIAGHRYSVYQVFPLVNTLDAYEWPSKLYTQYIQSSIIAVDTFFFLSGMMISYGYFYAKIKPKGIFFIPKYYLHRYLRLTPAIAVLYFVSVTILKHFGSGPLWPFLFHHMSSTCLKWWWSYFLYVQNYVNHNEMCLEPTWYLSADMQMFVLSPLILLPLGYLMVRVSKNIIYAACASLILIFMIIQTFIKLNVESSNPYMTHERLSVWMVGFTFGIFLQDIKSKSLKIKMNSLLNLLIWVVVLVGMVSILLTMHDVREKHEKLKTSMFETFHKPAWGSGLAWIIYSSTIGFGGFVNWFLSLPMFQVLSRLSYCMYVVHILPIGIYSSQTRTSTYFTDFNAFYTSCGDTICTVILALIWVLAFESPMIAIEKCIFHRGSDPKKENETEKTDLDVPITKSGPDV